MSLWLMLFHLILSIIVVECAPPKCGTTPVHIALTCDHLISSDKSNSDTYDHANSLSIGGLGTTEYHCIVPLNEDCPDLPESSQHAFIDEILPKFNAAIARLTGNPLEKLNKICKYTKLCQRFGMKDCFAADSKHFDRPSQYIHDDVWNRLPDKELIAYTLYPKGLTDYTHMLPRDKKTLDKPEQHKQDIQYHVGWRHDTFVIYFDGTELLRRDRTVDRVTNLRVGHAEKNLKFHDTSVKLRVHEGYSERLEQDHFLNALSEILDIIYDNYLKYVENEHIYMHGNMRMPVRPKRLVISGHSLGGGYALWFFLMVFGDNDPHNKWRQIIGGKHKIFEQMDITDVTVVTYGAPFIIYYKDVSKIPKEVSDRVVSFVDFKDPIPKSLAGAGAVIPIMQKIKLGTETLKSLGTNGAIGDFFVIYHKDQDKSVWMENTLWSNPSIRFGSICWWWVKVKEVKKKLMSTLKYALQNHLMNTYRERIILSLTEMRGSMDQLKNDIGYFKYLLDDHAHVKMKVGEKGYEMWVKQSKGFRDLWNKIRKKRLKAVIEANKT